MPKLKIFNGPMFKEGGGGVFGSYSGPRPQVKRLHKIKKFLKSGCGGLFHAKLPNLPPTHPHTKKIPLVLPYSGSNIFAPTPNIKMLPIFRPSNKGS
jgi:hypothetical protein